jgi:hypothetical protein
MTQTWLGAESVAGDNETYEGVTCLACSKQHFICIASGHVLGEDEARPSLRRVPVLLPKQIRRIHDRANASVVGEGAGVVRTPTDWPKAC